MMRQIAQDSNGQYFLAADREQLENVYITLDELEPIEYEEESYRPARMLYFYPLAIVLIISLLNQLIFALLEFLRR